MSRQELADAVNAYAYQHAGRRVDVDARYVGKLERGEHRWPYEPCRTALREFLGKATDAELGFFVIHGHASDPEANPVPEPSLGVPAVESEDGVSAIVAFGDAGDGLIVPGGAATVRVRLTVEAAQVRVVRDQGPAGRVAVLAGPVEVLIEPSDATTILAPSPARSGTAADGSQVR
ncbi:hypothetical protein AB0M35_03200 [Micromonospora sp. NPDC051196]|uniref:hypothetical protein n=1 Tax=Micromonospora sp. NPDC051196 TaxID=3155281 RepID=UPI0034209B18